MPPPQSPPPPPWVLDKVREMTAEGKSNGIIAGQLGEAGHTCTERQVKRWKAKKGIRHIWRGDDAALDRLVLQLRQDDKIGYKEGHHWCLSRVNARIPGTERVGRQRLCKAFKRLFPAEVAARGLEKTQRMTRRVYKARYYLQNDHLDLQCKLFFRGVKLYIFGIVDGDSRWIKRLCILYVKTARSALLRGYIPALREDGMLCADKLIGDAVRDVDCVPIPPSRHSHPPLCLRAASGLRSASLCKSNKCAKPRQSRQATSGSSGPGATLAKS